MVDTSTIDLPSATPSLTAPAQPTQAEYPDIGTMLNELQQANALQPELVPQALQSITTLPLVVPITPIPVAPIQLATTATQFISGTAPSETYQTWKWLSWAFIALSLVVAVMVLINFWQQGVRVEVRTDASDRTSPLLSTP